MRSILSKIIRQFILPKRQMTDGEAEGYSPFEMAKGYYELKLVIFRTIKDIIFIIAGIAAAAFGLESFLLPINFIDGGATGISLLISETTKLPLSLFLLIINIPFVLVGYKIIGKTFAIKTALAITGLALTVAFVHFKPVTDDKLLVAVFGGFFLGAGIGLSVRGGAVLDGTEVLAIFLSRKLGTKIGDIVIAINIVIFSVAATLLSIEAVLYSMITYLVASRTLDFIVEGIEEYTAVTIISPHSDEIRDMIINKMGRGVTLYKGERGFGKRGETKNVDIVFTVITRLELNKLNIELIKIDPHAFVVMNSVRDTRGGMIKKRPLKH